VRKPVLSGSFALALLLCMASGFHTFRYIYLFPFLFVFAATGMEQLGRRSTYWGRGLLVCILVHGTLTAVLSYAGMSLVYKGRSATALTDALRDVVGPGAKRVYSRTLQDYYAGRDLGWEHYRYAADPLVTDDELHAGLLARVDYVIDPVTRPYYAIEESFTLYGVIRDRLIRAARGASEDDRQDEPSVPPRFPRIHNYCVQLGRTLALAAAAADEQRAFDQKLAALGFRRTQTVNLTVPASAYTPFARWVLSIQATNPDYDKLVIWRRTKPGDGPSDDTQTR
jgi:hypothetical protein